VNSKLQERGDHVPRWATAPKEREREREREGEGEREVERENLSFYAVSSRCKILFGGATTEIIPKQPLFRVFCITHV